MDPAPSPMHVFLGHTNYNQFITLDERGRSTPEERLSSLARRVCASALADDLLVVDESPEADLRLRIFGADGRAADYCGNGALLVADQFADQRTGDSLLLDSPVGLRRARHDGNSADRAWCVEVGPARSIESPAPPSDAFEGGTFHALLHAGEPHAVVSAPRRLGGFHVEDRAFEAFCAPLRDAFGYPGGVNVTLLFDRDGDYLALRTYERGNRRQTRSCGTGAAAAIAAVHGPTSTPKWAVAPGGTHRVTFEDGVWWIADNPRTIARGVLEDDSLHLPLDALERARRSDPQVPDPPADASSSSSPPLSELTP